MAIPPRTRKRVHAIRRAPDGSAFQKCDWCGMMVAIVLADMHECRTKKNVKRFKGLLRQQQQQNVSESNYLDQPRSAFRFFMESFEMGEEGNLIDIDRKGFEIWKKMSKTERLPYLTQAEKVNSACEKLLNEELIHYSQADDDEADSAMVGMFDQFYEDYEESEFEDSDLGGACDYRFETCRTKFDDSFSRQHPRLHQNLTSSAHQVKDCK